MADEFYGQRDVMRTPEPRGAAHSTVAKRNAVCAALCAGAGVNRRGAPSRTDVPMAALPPPRSVWGLFLVFWFVPCFWGGRSTLKGVNFRPIRPLGGGGRNGVLLTRGVARNRRARLGIVSDGRARPLGRWLPSTLARTAVAPVLGRFATWSRRRSGCKPGSAQSGGFETRAQFAGVQCLKLQVSCSLSARTSQRRLERRSASCGCGIQLHSFV